jgi:hypothetical protein
MKKMSQAGRLEEKVTESDQEWNCKEFFCKEIFYKLLVHCRQAGRQAGVLARFKGILLLVVGPVQMRQQLGVEFRAESRQASRYAQLGS